MANAPMIPKIPPIRTDIQNPQQSSALNRPPAQGVSNGSNTASNGGSPQHRTSKEWYYYWSKVGEQVVQNTQTLNGLVTYGPHSGKPDPSTVPNGAIAVESDRGVIYQNELIQGVPTWRYLAGTMWGTISPDQRPTDLGVHDAGFEYRTTDQPPRTFLWSGGAWVETTAARYDTHANRLAQPVANLAEGALWVETDRGNVIYQLQGTTWKYLAGTMLGTISPDQRPSDLGANDAGFRFWGTATALEFMWSGTSWVQMTPVAPQAGTAQISESSSDLSLATSTQDVPGTQMTLARAGRYWLHAIFDFSLGGADAGYTFIGLLNINGATGGPAAAFCPQYVSGVPGGNRATVAAQQIVSFGTAGAIVKLQAYKTGGTGFSTVMNTNTTLAAIWISP